MTRRIALLLLLAPAAGLADIEMRFSDGTVGLVRDGHVLFGDDEDRILFEPGSDSMIVIDTAERTWMRLERGFVKEMAAQMQAQMEAMLAGMPPEQRAMMEAQMEGMLPQVTSEMPPMRLNRTGESAVVAGYDCEETEISYEDGSVEEIVCIASPGELGVDREDFDALVAAMKGMAAIASLDPRSAPQADFGAMGGVPIRTRAGEYGVESELVSLSTDDVDAARLEVPDGYREISMQEMMQQ